MRMEIFSQVEKLRKKLCNAIIKDRLFSNELAQHSVVIQISVKDTHCTRLRNPSPMQGKVSPQRSNALCVKLLSQHKVC